MDEGDISFKSIPTSRSIFLPDPFKTAIDLENIDNLTLDESIFGSHHRFSFNDFNYQKEVQKASSEFYNKYTNKLSTPDNKLINELIVKKIETLKEEITKLEVKNISQSKYEKSRTVIVCLSGFLSEDDD